MDREDTFYLSSCTNDYAPWSRKQLQGNVLSRWGHSSSPVHEKGRNWAVDMMDSGFSRFTFCRFVFMTFSLFRSRSRNVFRRFRLRTKRSHSSGSGRNVPASGGSGSAFLNFPGDLRRHRPSQTRNIVYFGSHVWPNRIMTKRIRNNLFGMNDAPDTFSVLPSGFWS